MSAIAGIVGFARPPILHTEVDAMLKTLRLRGPDGHGSWIAEGGVAGLGHARLTVTPEAPAVDPLVDPRRGLVVVADARLDNREELCQRLGLGTRRQLCDTELILRAYARWAEQCPTELLGDFAFAVWDGRQRQLFCARDHIGAKPLYYYGDQRFFAFATEIKALLRVEGVPRRLNEQQVGRYLVRSFEHKTATFYRQILRLPPAHGLCARPDGARLQRYWSLRAHQRTDLPSGPQLTEALRHELGRAVRCCLRSATPPGALLSGGLDSSTVVCLAREALRSAGTQRLHTFSAIFVDLPPEDLRRIDEHEQIQAVVQGGELNPCAIRADQLSPLLDAEEVLQIEDEPIYSPNFYIHWAACNEARARGLHVLLDGVGGDEVISHGTELLGQLARSGRWARLYAESRALANHRRHLNARQVIWRLLLRPELPDAFFAGLNLLRGRPRHTGLNDPIIRRAFARRVGVSESGAWQPLSSLATAREQHLRQLSSGLFPYVLELANKAAATRGVEMRYPFLDRRLMEFCVAVPPERKFRDGWDRHLLRQAMEGLLPPAVQWRVGKASLASNFFRQLLQRERGIIESVILEDPAVIAPYVNLTTLRGAYQRYRADPTGRNGCAQEAVYAAVMLALWLRRSGVSP